jgi:hypothetical protein
MLVFLSRYHLLFHHSSAQAYPQLQSAVTTISGFWDDDEGVWLVSRKGVRKTLLEGHCLATTRKGCTKLRKLVCFVVICAAL